ncbi:GreA/GreB family elongation factor [Chitinophaga qingshengii]|uniref:GreA/GreB family elongation factor n=1 Tax=Chitinophaga qingshengii TaxID=1569794 RepID=A0ABR7TTJ3_9BACT|nr:GreA/GreB family elongation factor [Chitinophaga qingshengii]MBC9932729.1 GreA/GreB family elongation factor [Chitinophaga qingshengii]
MDKRVAHKLLLKQYCEQVILQRIAITQQAMNEAQAAANSESKSSVGDKYETARAMSHMEKDMHARQLLAHQQELQALRSVNVQSVYQVPAAGAFIRSTTANFFIGAGLGKQVIDGETIIFLSPISPLAQQLMRKKAGDEFEFKGKNKIIDVY